MVDLVYYLTNWMFFDISLVYYYSNLRSSIVLGDSSRDIYPLFVTVSKLFCGEVLGTFVILLAIFLPINSSVSSFVFWNYFCWSNFKCICFQLFNVMKKFEAVFTI